MDQYNSELHQLFATPVWKAQLPPVTEEEFEFIKNMEYVPLPRDDRHLHLTKKTYVLDTEPELARIRENIVKAVEYYWHNVLYVQPHLGLRTLHSWITRHSPGESHAWHQDPNSLLSAVFYIKKPEGAGQLHFRKDLNLPNLFPVVMEMKYTRTLPFNTRIWSVETSESEMIVFPSHIEHQAEVNTGTEDRYALVLDFWPTGTLNYQEDGNTFEQEIYNTPGKPF